jgi:3-phosphoshikimate 1-carboxyvinyltransferase
VIISSKQKAKSIKKDLPLIGEIEVAADKSISHRSLIFASLAHGESKIYNLLEGEDVIRTAEAMRKMGVEISKVENTDEKKSYYLVNGSGVAGLTTPDDIIDMGNSGTSSRLLAGLVSSYDFTTFFTGDASLRKRPMSRVFEPIKQIGAEVIARNDSLMPFAIIGAGDYAMPISYHMKVASAQVKSAILLAAMKIIGTTEIYENQQSRDHTEIMMRYLGIKISKEKYLDNGLKISFSGFQEFDGKDFTIPGDISSAAFFIVAALIIKNSKITIKNVGINPLRDGIIKTLLEMGGNIIIKNQREVGCELVADIEVQSSNLKGVEIEASRAPSMIDEYPIIAIAAAFAEGETKMNGIAELKVKESNRLQMIADNLTSCGVEVKVGDDFLIVKGGISEKKEIVKIKTAMDHRIAMSFLVMGTMIENGIEIDDCSMIKTSFPNFEKIFQEFGYDFSKD